MSVLIEKNWICLLHGVCSEFTHVTSEKLCYPLKAWGWNTVLTERTPLEGFQEHPNGLGPDFENFWCMRMFIPGLCTPGGAPLPSHCHQPPSFRLVEASEPVSCPLTSRHSQPWREFFIKHYMIMPCPSSNPPVALHYLVSTLMPKDHASRSDCHPNSQP